MGSSGEKRRTNRVRFDRGVTCRMMAIDGTWQRSCIMEDVSQTGAKLTIDGTVQGLPVNEFFLALSSTGLAYRRCQLVWLNGDQMGVVFLQPGQARTKAG